MISSYIIFSLENVSMYMFNAIFIKQVLGLGGPYTFLGLSGSCFSFLCLIWKPIAGSLSDKRGISKLLIWCLLAKLIGTIFCFASTTLVILFLSRLILAFGSPVQVLVRTIITNVEQKTQSENLAKLGIATAISFIGAALISGEVMGYTNKIDYMYGLLILNIAISLILTKNLSSTELIKKDKSKVATSPLEEITSALYKIKELSTSETYWDIFLLKALVALSYGIMDINMVMIFEDKGIAGKNFGYLVTIVCLLSIVANALQVKITKIFYNNDIGYLRILHMSVILIFSLLAQGFISNIWIFIIFFNITGICRFAIDNPMMEILLRKVNNEEKATVLGSFESMQSLTDLVAPIIASITLQYLGIPAVYLMSSLLMALVYNVAYIGKNKTDNVKSNLKKQ